MADSKATGNWVRLEFIKKHGTKKVGDKEVYHVSTADSLIKAKVAKELEKLKKYVPAKIKK